MSNNDLLPILESWSDFPSIVNKELAILKQNSIIVEIGGGANPYLTSDQVKDFRYIVIDIDLDELSKSKGDHFEKICTDITLDNKGLKCDIIISNMLLEHIPNPQDFHKACFEMLNAKGKAIHFFATKFSPASIVNIMLPEKWSRRLLYAVQNRKWETEGKFPAFYRWCVGPTNAQIKRFEKLGYHIASYRGYVGSGYLTNIPIINVFEKVYNKVIFSLKSPLFCSNAIVILFR